MLSFDNFFKKGLRNTLEFKGINGFTLGDNITSLQGKPRLDRWHVGEFCSAEYTASVDYDPLNKEIIKFLLVATSETAKISVYSRVYSNIEMIDVEAILDNSYVDVFLSAKNSKFENARVVFTVNYFKNHS